MMGVNIKNLIAAINPELYCDDTPDEMGVRLKDKVKEVIKKEGYAKAAEIAKLKRSDYVDVKHMQLTKSAVSLAALRNPLEMHRLGYDAPSKSLEEVYFWILDFVSGLYGKTDKLVDNFISSAGSGFFSEFSQRATRMQEEGMKIFERVNVVIKSVLNLIYDLKEFEIRLAQYDDYHSKDKRISGAALLGLKQIWMDNVDAKRGNSSIKGLAQQFDYVTLIDAFMAADSSASLMKNPNEGGLDLNDRVRRILVQRMGEFELWLKQSEIELRKRAEIEKLYLKSQLNSAKLYARWAQPYLKAAMQLEQRATPTADIVGVFNTALFELAVLAEGRYDLKSDVAKGELPRFFEKLKLRKYSPFALIEFSFRSIPDRNDQRGGYGYVGRVQVDFTGFSMNEDEAKMFKQVIEEQNVGDLYKVIAGAAEESIAKINEDVKRILGEEEKKEEKKAEDDVNPFTALFKTVKEKKEEKKDYSKGIPSDSNYEKILRNQTILSARNDCRKTYDTYKKVHGMASFPAEIN